MSPRIQNSQANETSTPSQAHEKAHQKASLAALRSKLQQLEHNGQRVKSDVLSSGCKVLDQFLPQGGFQRGQLIEWLSAYQGSGATCWALQSCRIQTTGALAANNQSIVIIDTEHTFYPPAAFGMGIDLERLVIIRPKNAADAMWALDQSLRCPAVAAACAVLPRLDPRDFRRLQLAAEQGNTIGHLLRPLSVHGQPSWSDFQLLVRPKSGNALPTKSSRTTTPNRPANAPSRGSTRNKINKGTQRSTGPPMANVRTWQIELLRCRGGRSGTVIHATGDITNGKWLSPTATENSPLSNSTTVTKFLAYDGFLP